MRALITGINGQDGSYLAEFLLEKNYEVIGIMRQTSSQDLDRIFHLADDVPIYPADVTDLGSLIRVLRACRPNEVYNLAANSFVGTSWTEPRTVAEITGMGALNVLEAVRLALPGIKVYQASSSEMFGNQEGRLDESAPFAPCSPYGVAKCFAHHMVQVYRESYGMFACAGILFNHESPRRGPKFVTRKISMAAAQIKEGLESKVSLGNIAAERDWGYAGDYVRAMWLMLQEEIPKDYVVATGVSHSVADFVKLAFDHVGLNWEEHVTINEAHMRPKDVHVLCGSPRKVMQDLGWEPTMSFEDLVKTMVDEDLKLCRTEQWL